MITGSNLKQLLQEGYNLADRDAEGYTAKELAQMEGVQANVEVFGKSAVGYQAINTTVL